MLVAANSGFADRLRSIREAAGLSQYELAKRSGVTAQAISRIEKGEREPNWLTVLKLARALDVSVSDFDTGLQFADDGGQDEPPDPPPPPRRGKK